MAGNDDAFEEKSLLVLFTNNPARLEIDTAQKRAWHLFDSKGIDYEVVAGDLPEFKDRRNELFGVSGKRGLYPQFFFKFEKDNRVEYIGDWEFVDQLNENSDIFNELWEKLFGYGDDPISRNEVPYEPLSGEEPKRVVRKIKPFISVQQQQPKSEKSTPAAEDDPASQKQSEALDTKHDEKQGEEKETPEAPAEKAKQNAAESAPASAPAPPPAPAPTAPAPATASPPKPSWQAKARAAAAATPSIPPPDDKKETKPNWSVKVKPTRHVEPPTEKKDFRTAPTWGALKPRGGANAAGAGKTESPKKDFTQTPPWAAKKKQSTATVEESATGTNNNTNSVGETAAAVPAKSKWGQPAAPGISPKPSWGGSSSQKPGWASKQQPQPNDTGTSPASLPPKPVKSSWKSAAAAPQPPGPPKAKWEPPAKKNFSSTPSWASPKATKEKVVLGTGGIPPPPPPPPPPLSGVPTSPKGKWAPPKRSNSPMRAGGPPSSPKRSWGTGAAPAVGTGGISSPKPAWTGSSPKPAWTGSSPKPAWTGSSPKPAWSGSSPKPAWTSKQQQNNSATSTASSGDGNSPSKAKGNFSAPPFGAPLTSGSNAPAAGKNGWTGQKAGSASNNKEDGSIDGTAPPQPGVGTTSSGAALQKTGEKITKFYSLKELQNQNSRPDLDIPHLEKYLAPNDFQEIFHMSKEEFDKLKNWKKDQLKQEVGLF